jgi:hypothetical protein
MQNSELTKDETIIRNNTLSLEWKVVYVRYPRETEAVSKLKIKWLVFGKLRVPKIFFQQKRVESQEASVNYDLLCCDIESHLNDYSAKGYELFSIISTHSGFSSIVQTAPRPQPYFLKTPAAKTSLRAEEALMLIFRKTSSDSCQKNIE